MHFSDKAKVTFIMKRQTRKLLNTYSLNRKTTMVKSIGVAPSYYVQQCYSTVVGVTLKHFRMGQTLFRQGSILT